MLSLADESLSLDTVRALIVVGAHLSAEAHDRPIAHALRERLVATLRSRGLANSPTAALVCTDIWWLNQPALERIPTISVGAPEVNALTARLASRLPTVFSVHDRFIVQADDERDEPHVACWGATPADTAQAVEAFISRGLDAFLLRAAPPGA